MPGRLPISGTRSRVITELVSACEPPRRTIAVVSSPVLLSVAWKPWPIASIATSTPTTPAMPTTITELDPQRCGNVAMPMRAAASESRPLRVATSHTASNPPIGSSTNHGSAIQAASPIASSTTDSALTPRSFHLRCMCMLLSAAGECIDDLQALRA